MYIQFLYMIILNNAISMYMYNEKIKKIAAYFKILYISHVILFSLKIQNLIIKH